MSQDTINQRIKDLIEALNLSARAFSKTIGVGDTNTRNYLDRGSKPNSEYLGKILRHFNHINPTWLLLGEGEMFLSDISQMNSQQGIGQQNGNNNKQNVGSPGASISSSASELQAKLAQSESEKAALQREVDTMRELVNTQKAMIALLQKNQAG